MPATLKKLHQSQIPAVAGTLLSVPVGQTWLIKSFVVVNTDDNASRNFTLYDGGTAVINEIVGRKILEPNADYQWEGFMVVEAGGSIRGVADAAAAVTITVYGVVMT